MQSNDELIPPPPVVRERLGRNLREARLLRRLLSLSVAAAEERHRQTSSEPGPDRERMAVQ